MNSKLARLYRLTRQFLFIWDKPIFFGKLSLIFPLVTFFNSDMFEIFQVLREIFMKKRLFLQVPHLYLFKATAMPNFSSVTLLNLTSFDF